MLRWKLIFQDRVERLKRGLVKAGYLDDPVKAEEQEEKQEERDESFRKLASSVLTDLLHLGVFDYQVRASDLPGADPVPLGGDLTDGEIQRAADQLLKEISVRAVDNFMKERSGRRP